MGKQKELNEIMNILRRSFPKLSEQYSVETLGVFGSHVRSEQDLESDLDILVTFSEVPGLLRFIELENYLSDLLGVQVDLVMKSALKPALGQRILAEVISL
jgi:predicted nucleotidyltransferase